MKMAKWWSEDFQKVSKILCEYLSDSFLLCLTLFWCSVPLFPSSLSSTIMLGLLMPYFGSCTIFFTRRSPPGRTLLHFGSRMRTIFWSPPGRTSTTWLVVWGQDHRNRAHAVKVWWIYIHTYIHIHTNATWLHCTIISLALRRLEINVCKCVGGWVLVWLCGVVYTCRYVGIYRSVESSSFSSNSDSCMELKMHHPLFPSYIYLHTLTGKPLLPGFRPHPHPDYLCGAVFHLWGATGMEDQVWAGK